MNVIIAVGTVNAWLLALLIQTKKSKARPDKILSLFFLLQGLGLGVLYSALEWRIDGLYLLLEYINLLFAPIFYFYVASMVDPEDRLPAKWPWHFLPYAAANIYLLTILSTYSEVQITLLYQVKSFLERPFLHNMFYLLDLAAISVYLVLSWWRLKLHGQRIADVYSYRKSVDYRWLQRLIWVALFSWAVIDLPLFGGFFIDALNTRQTLIFGAALNSLAVLYLGYFGFRQTSVYVDAVDSDKESARGSTPTEPTPERYQKSGLSPDEIRHYRDQLLQYMEKERPHLDPALTIRELAGAVGLSEHNASEVINVGLGKRFYDFVNGYRVEEFKQHVLRSDQSGLTLLAVALQCGFNSKSSFNRIFKQHQGLTPSAYAKSIPDHVEHEGPPAR